jgi:MoxR-like ATPase
MPKKGSKKESGNAGVKSPDSKVPAPRKARGGGPQDDDDDSSIDSKGNIRNLIVSDSDSSSEPSVKKHSKKRKAAVAASNNIQKALKKEGETSPHGTLKNKEARSKSSKTGKSKFMPPKKEKKVESEEEYDSDEDEDYDEDEDEDYDEGDYDDDEDESEDESEEDEEDYYGDEDDESEETDEDSPKKMKKRPGSISISFGIGAEDPGDKHIPKRHNLKKESELVRKFVKLVTAPIENDGIDMQIDQFKALDGEKQEQLVQALQKKPSVPQENMMFKILTMKVTPEIQAMILSKYHALQDMDPSSGEYYKHRSWLEKLTSLPLGLYKEMPVKLDDGMETCGGFMGKARDALASAIYGQQESKLQILQFIASKIANPTARGLNLLLVGPPGIGKTSLIKNGIAKALDWPFQFISLGGDSDATTYTGHQLVYEGSHAGKIVNSLIAAKSMSMVLMFDELDKISATAKGEEVQNLLIHMTDSVQNCDFEDKYLSGVPLDLSRAMFVFSGNDITKIDKVLLDRMIVIKLKGYDKKEKLAIAENFLLPAALKEVNLAEKVDISHDILEYIVTEYAGDEDGVRELKRCIEQIAQKINMLRIFNTKDLPFHIPDFHLPFLVKKIHVDLFLKKKDNDIDVSVQRMYL